MTNGMGSHQSPRMKTDEWLTPPCILEALGPFDLDPCAVAGPFRPWPTAAWKEAVIATGNAIVPQVAYQILKPIAEALQS